MGTPSRIRVLSVDDHPLLQEGIAAMIKNQPDMGGIDAMIAIRTEFAEARIIILTTFEGDVEIQRALEAGARGYLLKSMPPKECSKESARSTRARSASRRRSWPISPSTSARKQIVPIGDSAMLSSKVVKGSTLKIYRGAPHGLTATHKDQVNADLLAFLKA
jgi:DNA-binding NarL/FixJ family response regulator